MGPQRGKSVRVGKRRFGSNSCRVSSSAPDPPTPRLTLDGGSFPAPGTFVVLASLLSVLESQAVLTPCPCSSGETPRGRVRGLCTGTSTGTPGKLWSVPLCACRDWQVPMSCLSGWLFAGAAHATTGTQSLPA